MSIGVFHRRELLQCSLVTAIEILTEYIPLTMFEFFVLVSYVN